ncbi:hypothetical protein H5410_054803 [Solanum commersonii]|uniref:Uncharacterized protein n=1 Tax=Solanum commersonii TaxID=4109 RepID=A0A9J5WGT7_SOLCO|nr:hypothetical protein H5410_054803 [Solanum commersonii]
MKQYVITMSVKIRIKKLNIQKPNTCFNHVAESPAKKLSSQEDDCSAGPKSVGSPSQKYTSNSNRKGLQGCPGYTKVAKAKSRLAKLIIVQVVTQLMIATNVFVSLSKNESPDRVSVVSLAIGFVSVVAGELGRKKSQSNFLKFYVFGSSMAILLSAFQNFTSLETLKIAAVLLGFVVQLFVIGTTISLIKNMAPPKRAS